MQWTLDLSEVPNSIVSQEIFLADVNNTADKLMEMLIQLVHKVNLSQKHQTTDVFHIQSGIPAFAAVTLTLLSKIQEALNKHENRDTNVFAVYLDALAEMAVPMLPRSKVMDEGKN